MAQLRSEPLNPPIYKEDTVNNKKDRVNNAQKDLMRAEIALKRAGTEDELFCALEGFMEAHYNLYHRPPKVIDIQRRFFTYFKKILGTTSVLSAIQSRFLEDEEFAMAVAKVEDEQGPKGPYLLVPKASLPGTKSLTPDHDLDSLQLPEVTEENAPRPKSDQNLGDLDWLDTVLSERN